MIGKLKNTWTKIILYEFIQISPTHREALYDIFKNEYVPTITVATTFSNMIYSWKHVNIIRFDDIELPSKDVVEQSLALYIKVYLCVNNINRSLIDTISCLNIFSTLFLQHFQDKGLPPITTLMMKIKGFDNVKKQCVGMIHLPI